jgi:spore coat polysaccharide biosynthesis protein SpsF
MLTLIQARRGSSRLPDKVSLDLCGKPLLVRQVERVQQASKAGRVAVITTDEPSDDALVELCQQHGIARLLTCLTATTKPRYTLARQRP